MMTQYASQLERTRTGKTIVEAVPTQILLPNIRASAADYAMLGLSGKELDVLLGEQAAALDLFDRCQLGVVVQVCRNSANLSEAGRRLFASSRQAKKVTNDADRLRKYLARFGLDWAGLKSAG